MRFEYEIPEDEYVAAQALYYRLAMGSRRRVGGATSVLAGVFFVVVAWNEQRVDWAPILLAALGVWWGYVGMVNLLPGWYLRRGYRRAGVEGKRYQADVNEEGFEVRGDVRNWRVRWAGVSAKGENKLVFMCYAANTVFTFGKKYLTEEQQTEFRRLAGLMLT